MRTDLPEHPFRARQAPEFGLSRQQLRLQIRDGAVRPILSDVYVRGDVPDSIDLRVAAAALVVPSYAVVCDRTAAWLFGVDVWAYHELEILPPIDVFVIRDYRARRRRHVSSGQRDLDPLDLLTLENGMLVTTPLRTALDLGCALPRSHALAAVDQFVRLAGVTQREMLGELPRFRGRRGVVQLRQIVRLADGRSESPGESFTRLAIIDAGLPPPLPQFWVCEGGRKIYRLDLAYPKHRVCVEYDGEPFHSSPAQRAEDARRRDWLRARGWIVIVVTKSDLDRGSVQRWTGELRDALTSRTR